MKLIYETYRPSKTDFNSFLNQCKRAINKLYGFNVSVKHDFWSTIDHNTIHEYYKNKNIPYEERVNKTYWEILKETGSLSINDCFHCIDFQFDVHVYADWYHTEYINQGLFTKEEYEEYIKSLE